MKIQGLQNSYRNNYNPAFKAGVANLLINYKTDYIGEEYAKKIQEGTLTPEDIEKINEEQIRRNNFMAFNNKGVEGDAKLVLIGTSPDNIYELKNFMGKLSSGSELNIAYPDILITDNGASRFRVTTDEKPKTKTLEFKFTPEDDQAKNYFIFQRSNWDANSTSKKIDDAVRPALLDLNDLKVIRRLRSFIGSKKYSHAQAVEQFNTFLNSKDSPETISSKILKLWDEHFVRQDASSIRAAIMTAIKKLSQNIVNLRNKNLTVITAETKSASSSELLNYDTALKNADAQTVELGSYMGKIGDSNLRYSIVLPDTCNGTREMENIRERLDKMIAGEDISAVVEFEKASEKFSHPILNITPKVKGRKLNNIVDIQSYIHEIARTGADDVIIVAASKKSHPAMLNLYNYVYEGKVPKEIDPQKLKEVFKLPLITIFIDESETIADTEFKGLNRDLAHMDNIFNADGNVRFIHVTKNIPNDGKPSTLDEAFVIAQQEYAKRNKDYRAALPKKILRLYEYMHSEYPIDRNVSRKIEELLGESIWNPIKHWSDAAIEESVTAVKNKSLFTKFKEVIMRNKVTAFLILSCLAFPALNAYLNKKRAPLVQSQEKRPI